MGEMEQDAKTTAAGLSDAMINALDCGRYSNGRARVYGRENTLHALSRRGLIDEQGRWTKLGFEVAARVLDGTVPTYDEVYPVIDEQLVGRYVVASGATAHRGRVVRLSEGGQVVHVQTHERVMTFAALNVSIMPEAAVQALVGRKFCRKGQHSCVPAVTLTFRAGAGRLHWCAEHAADADEYRDQADVMTADGPVAPSAVDPAEGAQQRVDLLGGQLSADLTAIAQAVEFKSTVPQLRHAMVLRIRQEAVQTMRYTLDGWIEGAESNCEALGHGGASSHDDGRLCGQAFEVEDIRKMIADAARELGIPE